MSDLRPGEILTDDSGGRWIIGDQIGMAADPRTECDAEHPSAYLGPDGEIVCRCIVCARCGHHTGNSNQGHYWAHCKVLAARLRPEAARLATGEWMRRTSREFHFCCDDPAYGCELDAGGSASGE